MQKIGFISFGLFGEFICEIMPIGFSLFGEYICRE